MNENAVYNAKLIEIKDNLEQLNEIGIENTNIANVIKEIKKNLSKDLAECYEKYENSVFLEESIAKLYQDATKKLENINQSLIREYQEFYVLYQMLLELKEKKITENNLLEIIAEIKVLLNKILLSRQTTEGNEKFLEKVYEFVYYIIKFEIIYNSNSILLDYTKTDPVHITYLVKCIKEEIKGLPKKTKKQIQEKIIEINKNGFDDIHYLDTNLLYYIIRANKKEYHGILEEFIENLFHEYETTQSDLENLKETISNRIVSIKESKNQKSSLTRKQLARKILFFLNLGILGSSIAIVKKKSDDIPPITLYETTTTYYDSSQPEQKEVGNSEYLKETSNTLTITEYSPWESPGYFREEYKRNIYQYTISDDIKFSKNVENYLTNQEYKDYITLSDSTTETSMESPTENYTENKYIISQTYQDRTVYKEKENKGLKFICLFGISAIIVMIDGVLYILYLSKRNPLTEKNELKKTLTEQRQLLLEEKTKANTLTEQLNAIKLKLNTEYEALPKILKEEEEIQKRIRRLNENE